MGSTFSIALSSLQAESEAIDITGNNLANINTVGYKGSTVDFRDLVTQTIGSGQGLQVGLGVGTPINNQQFTQGSLETSQSPLAVAIQGNGFFVLSGANNQQLFTRDGDFAVSSDGLLQTQTGENVQGWVATSSGIDTTGAPGNITLSTGTVLPPTATQNFSLIANLDAAANPTSADGTFSTPIQVIDSLGTAHTLTVTFTKNPNVENQWSFDVTIPSSDLAGGQAGQQTSVLASPGTLQFNTDGTLNTAASTSSPVAISVNGLADGAANMSINWNLLNSDGSGKITQFAESSGMSSSTQDGSPAAQMTDFGIQNGGLVVAMFSNGQQKVEAQLALASFQNPSSLQSAGNNNFSVTGQTAPAAIGLPQTGGRGQVVGGSLEDSNVDLATQFTKLIIYQQGYEASSKVITTADQMSQDLLNVLH